MLLWYNIMTNIHVNQLFFCFTKLLYVNISLCCIIMLYNSYDLIWCFVTWSLWNGANNISCIVSYLYLTIDIATILSWWGVRLEREGGQRELLFVYMTHFDSRLSQRQWWKDHIITNMSYTLHTQAWTNPKYKRWQSNQPGKLSINWGPWMNNSTF